LTIIKFPGRSGDFVDVYREALSSYIRALTSNEVSTVDLSDVQFVRPVGLNVVCCIIASLLLKGRAVHFQRPRLKDVERYLSDDGFYETFNVQGQSVQANVRATSVQLRRIDQLDIGYLDQIPYWLERNSTLDPRVIREVVQINLVEAIKNVLEHSRSSFGCYVCAQAYHKQTPPALVFCVMDFGVGFLSNLQPVYPEIRDDVTALKSAVESGVSSRRKIEQRARGAGLDVIRGFMKRMGRLEIVSGAGRWIQEAGGRVNAERLPFQFPGSYLLFNFEVERLKRYSEELDVQEEGDFF
jgi:hypothetical protein